jgi:hypothetical protein
MNPALWAEEDGFLDDPETREAALREALIWAGSDLPADTTHAPEPEPEPEPGAAEANAAAAADVVARLAAMEVATRRNEDAAAQRAAERAALKETKIAEANARQEKRRGYASRRDRLLAELGAEETAAAEKLAQNKADARSAVTLREREESDIDAEVASSAAQLAAASAEREARKLADHEASVAQRTERLAEKKATHARAREEKMISIQERYGW